MSVRPVLVIVVAGLLLAACSSPPPQRGPATVGTSPTTSPATSPASTTAPTTEGAHDDRRAHEVAGETCTDHAEVHRVEADPVDRRAPRRVGG